MGNAGVNRILAGANGAALQRCGTERHAGCSCVESQEKALQRFVETDGGQVSMGKKMRVDGPRQLYATKALIESTREKLEAKRSFFTIRQDGGPHPEHNYGQVESEMVLFPVKVEWALKPDDPRLANTKTNRAAAEHKQLAEMNQTDPTLRAKSRESSLFQADTHPGRCRLRTAGTSRCARPRLPQRR